MISLKELSEIKERESKATKGPWKAAIAHKSMQLLYLLPLVFMMGCVAKVPQDIDTCSEYGSALMVKNIIGAEMVTNLSVGESQDVP